MIPRIVLGLVALPVCSAFAEPGSWHEAVARLISEQAELVKEERGIKGQIEILEEQSKIKEEHIGLLRQRLAALKETPGPPETLDEAAATGLNAGLGEDDRKDREEELLSGCNDRIVILRGENGRSATAFIAPQEGKARVFASAPWIAANGSFSLCDLNGNTIPITQGIGCPAGIGLIALQPEKADLPVFVMTGENELPAVGDGILVVLADAGTKVLSGIRGSIRGIGPDTLEIDAELTPEMSGAPVLSLAGGKLIGIVAEQVTGVAEDWARGTRHEGSRNFVARLDRSREWQASDLGRFAKEVAYLAKLREKSRIAWIAHTLCESENWRKRGSGSSSSIPRPAGRTSQDYAAHERAKRLEKEEKLRLLDLAKEEAADYPNHPLIKRTMAWIRNVTEAKKYDPDSELDRSLISIYRDLLTDLSKKQPDASAHLSPYHREGYRFAMEEREECVRILTARINRVTR